MTLIFGTGVNFDPGYAGIVGQGRRSKVKAKLPKITNLGICPLPLTYDFDLQSQSSQGQGRPTNRISRS